MVSVSDNRDLIERLMGDTLRQDVMNKFFKLAKKE
jgi:hypothetical protein